MRRFFVFSFLLILFFTVRVFAAVPTGYYDAADAKNTNQLRLALKEIITQGFSGVSYSGLWTAYADTDINPATGKIWDMYSDCTFTLGSNQCGTYSSECNCYNREHTTPASWFSDASPMYSDLFNVYPTDGWVNNKRGNLPYGVVGSATYTSDNGSKVGSSGFSGYSGTVFEPIDEYKGDFARTVLYMATRYADNISTWITANSGSTDVEIVYHTANGLTSYAIDLFLTWSRNDPVSQKEINRNEAVYLKQNNRNPFIDFPGLEEYIWGNKTSQLFYVNQEPEPPVNQPEIILTGNVVNTGQIINFGTVSNAVQKSFRIKTNSIQGDLTVNVTGSMYSVSENIISQTSAERGYNLTVTFNPTTSGEHTGKVTISGGGLPNAFELNFTGKK
ncbi:MAG: endonuclease [Paludibacter sp.]|jgi:endonuclease I|nr:endonuclease [Paludibacter sp.]